MTANEWPRGRWGWVAGLGVAALVFLTVLDLSQHYRVRLGAGAVLGLGLARGLGLALAWIRPRAALVVSLLVTGITAAVTVPASPSEPWPWATTAVFGQSFVLAIVGARGLGRRELVTWWLVIPVFGAVAFTWAPERGDWAGLVVMAVLSGVAVVVGDLLRSRAETRRRLAEQEGISKEERAARARLEERARIARELHDVVAHHLSVVVVRADSAPHRLPSLQDDVRVEFAEIADAARASLTEMRRVLRLLREQPLERGPEERGPEERADQAPGEPSGGGLGAGPAQGLGGSPEWGVGERSGRAPSEPPGRAVGGSAGRGVSGDGLGGDGLMGVPVVGELGPQPGLGELGELVATTRQAGADVRLEDGVPTGLDPAVELAAYRVVQEALSNAVRHAPKAEVQVTVRRRGDELMLKVWNGPARSQQPPVPGSGHGLIGMRERVALLDGTVSMGPTPEGGYLVEASIPVGEEVASGDQGVGG